MIKFTKSYFCPKRKSLYVNFFYVKIYYSIKVPEAVLMLNAAMSFGVCTSFKIVLRSTKIVFASDRM